MFWVLICYSFNQAYFTLQFKSLHDHKLQGMTKSGESVGGVLTLNP